jgi:peptide deformylase
MELEHTRQKYKLITLPNKLLRHSSKRIGIIDGRIIEIVEAMKQSTLDWEDGREHEVGVALAAVQLGQLFRIITIRNDLNDKENRTFSVFINPVITKYEGDMVEDYEGCLSVKDIYGKVPRYSKVRVKATDINGKEFRLNVDGFLARTFQHEIDHTNGRLFIDHIKDSKDAFYELMSDGNLEKISYEKIQKNNILW